MAGTSPHGLYAWVDPQFCPRCGTALEQRTLHGDPRPRRVCPACAYVYYIGPKVAAGTLPIREDRVFLVRRGVDPGRGLWSFPCGYMELDETLEEAATRETIEETGLQIRLQDMLGVYTFPNPDGHIRVVVAAWLAEITAGTPAAADDVVEVKSFAASEVPWRELAFHSSHAALRRWLELRHPEIPVPVHRFP